MGTNNPNLPTNCRCDEEAIQYLASMVQALKTNTYITKTGAGPFTLTGTEMVGGTVEFSGSTTAVVVNTDTAANIQAAMTAIDPNAGVGSTANMTLMNDNTSSGAITVTAGANVTIVGVATIAIGVYRRYSIKWTAATTVSVTLIG
jgi:pectate lyase